MTMAEELPLLRASDSSPLCLKRGPTVNNDVEDLCNSNQQPILTLSPLPPSPATLEAAIHVVQETHFAKQNSLTFSPKKPKLSPNSSNPAPLAREVAKDEERQNLSGSKFLGKGTELFGGKSEPVQVYDKPLNLGECGSVFVKIESDKMNGNFERNKAICESLDLKNVVDVVGIEKLGVCSKNDSEKQSVAKEVGKANEISKKLESEEKNKNLGGFLHKLVKSCFESLNGDGLKRSLKIEVIDETALIDVLAIGGKMDKRVGKKVDSNGRRRFVYSRQEMEALRFINVKEQMKIWEEIYFSLAENVKKEYDQLGNFKHHHKPGKRNQNPGTRNYYGRGILSIAAARATWNYRNLFFY